MPRTKRDEDLFNQSSTSMSFLEHLDELRACLIGSLLCVTVGVVVTMIPIGKLPSLTTMAVDYIQHPLKKSLESYHIMQSQKQLQKKITELRELGYDTDIADAPAKLHMTAHPFYIFPKDLDVWRSAGVQATVGTSLPEEERARRAKLALVDNFGSYKDELITQTTLSSASGKNEPTMILLWEKIGEDARSKTRALSVQEYLSEDLVIFRGCSSESGGLLVFLAIRWRRAVSVGEEVRLSILTIEYWSISRRVCVSVLCGL